MQLKKWMIAIFALTISSTAAASEEDLIECELHEGKGGNGTECSLSLQECTINEGQYCRVRLDCTDGYRLYDNQAEVDFEQGYLNLDIKAYDTDDGDDLLAKIYLNGNKGKGIRTKVKTYINQKPHEKFYGQCWIENDVNPEM